MKSSMKPNTNADKGAVHEGYPKVIGLADYVEAKQQAGRNVAHGENLEIIQGRPAAPGLTKGEAAVMKGAEDRMKVKDDTILVCQRLSPSLTAVYPRVRGVIAEMGSSTCAAATVAREYGIPVVVDAPGAAKRIKDGDTIVLDGWNGLAGIIGNERDKKKLALVP
jgi:phosphohistidine swiveling domain-containing protein